MNLTLIDTSSLFIAVCHYVAKSDKKDDFAYCKKIFRDWFNTIINDTKADYYLAFTDESTNWRKQMFPDYKADRKHNHIQFVYELKKWAIEEYKIYSHPKLESDDLVVLNYNIWNNFISKFEDKETLWNCTIATPDSDIKTFPCNIYDYGYRRKKLDNPFITITPEEAEYNLWFNILEGGHNGFKGLEGCGEVYATNYLNYITEIDKKLDYLNILSAFQDGISKLECGKNIKGLGLLKGTIEYYKNFMTSYLLKTKEECDTLGINFDYITPISTKELKDSVTIESKEFEY